MDPLRMLVAGVIAVATLSSRPMLAAPADAEHDRLIATCGSWVVELTFKFQPAAPPVVVKGTSTIEPLFNGTFVQETIRGELNGVPFTTMAWTGFNTATHQYEATRISSTNTSRISETGAYDESAGELQLKAEYLLSGDTWRQRTVIKVLSPDAMLATSYLSFGAVPEWKAVEIKYSRNSK
jgi:hypothetical protein